MMIGMYTIGGFIGIMVILMICMAIERCRKKSKRITEVVEMNPDAVE